MTEALPGPQEGAHVSPTQVGNKIIQIAVNADGDTLFALTSAGHLAYTRETTLDRLGDKWHIITRPHLGYNIVDENGDLIQAVSDPESPPLTNQ